MSALSGNGAQRWRTSAAGVAVFAALGSLFWFFRDAGSSEPSAPSASQGTGAAPGTAVEQADDPQTARADTSQRSAATAPKESDAPADSPPVPPSSEAELPLGYSYPLDRAFTPDDWQLLVPMTDRVPVPDSVFEAKYSEERSHEEWLGQAATIGATVSNRAIAIGHRLEEEGFYELVRIPVDASGEPFHNWMGGSSEQTPLWTVNGGRGVPDGFVKVTWIPWPEYPELYDLRDEWYYLNLRAQAAK
jgi:hypothetical protein